MLDLNSIVISLIDGVNSKIRKVNLYHYSNIVTLSLQGESENHCDDYAIRIALFSDNTFDISIDELNRYGIKSINSVIEIINFHINKGKK